MLARIHVRTSARAHTHPHTHARARACTHTHSHLPTFPPPNLRQGVFFNAYFLAYLVSPRACHAAVGYLEEEAVKTYTHALKVITRDEGVGDDGCGVCVCVAKEMMRANRVHVCCMRVRVFARSHVCICE
jgi:bacterioferritin-associated ferredoxin